MRRTAWWGSLAGVTVCLAGTFALADKDTYQSAKELAAASKARAEAQKKQAEAERKAEAEKKKRESGSSRWWWPFGSDNDEAPADPPPAKTAKTPESKPKATALKPIVPLSEGPQVIAREQAKFLRRQQVCDRLREAAQDLDDATLEAQAELLEQRAWLIYEQRTAQARAPSMLPIQDTEDAKRLLGETKGRSGSDRPVRSVSTPKRSAGEED